MTIPPRTDWWRPLAVCLLAAALSGCFGPGRPIEFYTLAPLPRPAAGTTGAPGPLIAVYPAVLPATIDRPQIVTRSDENQIVFSEFDRWGGTLKDEISRTLVENLSVLLAARGASVMSDHLALEPAYRVGERVWLNAAWTVRDQKHKKMLALKTSVLEEKVAGPSYAELVAAQSRALAALSREIAAELSAMLKTP
jgi:uncharacterized protein